MLTLSTVQPIVENDNSEWIGYTIFFVITLLAVAGISYIIYGIMTKAMKKIVSPLKEELNEIKEQLREIKNKCIVIWIYRKMQIISSSEIIS